MQALVIYIVMSVAVAWLAIAVAPLIATALSQSKHQLGRYQAGKVEHATKALDDIFMEVKPRWLKVAYGIGPLLASAVMFMLTNSAVIALGGAVVGVVLPDMWLKQMRRIRRGKFQGQLVDALFILSSSLRAGLSLPQAFEQLESEMPAPASQEFGLMMKAHRLGRTLEESLQGLNERMPCDELNLITTAVLVARETGGDITVIINQMISTIRERKKLGDKVNTLTIQGRLQAYVMTALPVVFGVGVYTMNRHYFDPLLNEEVGKTIVAIAIGLWILGMVLLFRWSKVEV